MRKTVLAGAAVGVTMLSAAVIDYFSHPPWDLTIGCCRTTANSQILVTHNYCRRDRGARAAVEAGTKRKFGKPRRLHIRHLGGTAKPCQ